MAKGRKQKAKLERRQKEWEALPGDNIEPKVKLVPFDNKDYAYRKPGSNKK